MDSPLSLCVCVSKPDKRESSQRKRQIDLTNMLLDGGLHETDQPGATPMGKYLFTG